jgi:hypothetical protein
VAVRAYSGKDTYAPAAARVSSAGVTERSVIRLASAVVALLSFVLPLLGSEFLLYLERVLVVFAILLFLLVFLYRSLVHAELPKAISGRGVEWSDLTATSTELQRQVDELRTAVKQIREDLGDATLGSLHGQ